METLDPNSNPNSPNKRLKSETLTLIPSTPSLIDKGKAPIIADNDGENEDGYDSPANLSPENCGICFLEEGKTFRGLIDSCDHHFCFICIIEWSKIESRCPLCRERFSTIRRVRKDGSFIGQGSVRVPVRDQIYDPFGEPVDPYAQAKCSICNNTTDECLLLLCDLCDSASHTYCVGLGATVPEGDWYCRDCALLRAEQEDSEMGCDVVTSTVSPQVDEPPSTSASISIFDIVRDPKVPDSGTSRLLKLVSQKATKFSSSAIASDQPSIASARNVPDLRDNLHPAAELSGSSARTLRNCRNVHRHINVLRENWGAFRTGSLNFSSALSDSFGKAGQQKNVVGTSLKGSGKLQSSSTCSSETKVADSLHDARHYKESYNVDRAWKLMNIAKTVQRTDKSKSTSKIVKKNGHSIKRDKLLMKSSVSGRKDLTSPVLEEQRPTHNISGRPAQNSGKHHFGSFVSLAARTPGSKHQNSRVANLSMPTELQTASKDDISYNRTCFASSNKVQGRLSTILGDGSARSASSCGSIAVASDVSFAGLQRGKISARPVKQAVDLKIYSSSTRELQTSVQTDICRDKPALHSHASLRRGLSNNFDEQNSCACSTAYDPILDGFDASHVKLEGKKISACAGKVGDKITSKDSKDDEAKGEIQSLVKLNLKLLCKDKRLGVDAFKEIARLSTHTILASCGFEHRKIVRPLPRLVCHHGDQTQQDLFAAGSDTTSSTMEWAMAELLRNPEKLKKAQQELRETIGKGNPVQESNIVRLPYLQAIVKETFRLHPAVPFLVPRKVHSDVKLYGFTVPKNAQVLVNVWAIGRDPDNWEKLNLFEPERFMGLEMDVKGFHFELIPFGGGRRICPGLPLAIRMIYMMLGSLIHGFDWKLEGGISPEKMDMEEKFGFTLEKAQRLRAIPVCIYLS